MIVTVHLARAVNLAVGGEINILGLGWDVVGPGPLPAFVVLASVIADEELPADKVGLNIRLTDESGSVVRISEDPGLQKLDFKMESLLPPKSARAAGLPGAATAILEFGPGMILGPGLYRWTVAVNGETDPSWGRSFYVRAKPEEYRQPWIPPTKQFVSE